MNVLLVVFLLISLIAALMGTIIGWAVGYKRVAIPATIALIVLLPLFTLIVINNAQDSHSACEAKGGKILKARDRPYCIRKDVFL
jgi:hypothetical protein